MTLLSNTLDESIENQTIAFTVLNVESFGTFGKPNAIVRPVRRLESTEESITGQMTVGAIDAKEAVNTFNEMDSFTKQLDMKLKNLQPDKKNSSKNVIILTFSDR